MPASSVIYNKYDDAGKLTESWQMAANPKYMIAGSASTQDDLASAISNAAAGEETSIKLAAGTYTLYKVANDKTTNTTLTLTGNGAGNTSFNIGKPVADQPGEYNADYSYEGSEVSFKNMTVNVGTGDYKGFVRAKSLYFENCTIEGRGSYWGVGNVTFKNCIFNAPSGDYNITTYAGTNFTFDHCTFNSSAGKFVNAYKEQHTDITPLTFIGCKFIAETENKPAVCIKGYASQAWDVSFSQCALTNCKTDATTGSNYYLFDQGIENTTKVTIDNTVVWQNGAKL